MTPTPAEVLRALMDARDRVALAHDHTGGPLVTVVRVERDLCEQTHHGTTDYALAAWVEWARGSAYPRPPRTIARACGVDSYRMPGMDGARTLETFALVLTAEDGDRLALTGCAWGYGGEGPHGSALVLCDAGFFPDHPAALAFVSRMDGARPWELVRPNGNGRAAVDRMGNPQLPPEG